MKHNNQFLTSLVLLVSTASYAQQTILPSGGEAMGTGGTSSYSVGQVAYTTVTGTGGSSAQGVQHSYEVSDVSVATLDEEQFHVNVYPNPTTDFIVIQLKETHNEALSYRLVNSIGQEVQNGSLLNKTTQLSLNEHASAYYMLQIIKNNKITRTFKVLKTN